MGVTFLQSSGINDPVFGKYDLPIRMFMEKRAEAWQQKQLVPELFLMMKSDKFGEAVGGMTAMSGPKPVGENGAHPETSWQAGYMKRFEHMTWKNRLAMSRESVEDAKALDLKTKPAEFTDAHYRTRERFGAALYGAATKGETSTTFEGGTFETACADGLALFSAAHTSKIGGFTQSNAYTDAFSAEALAAAESAMSLFRGDAGETLSVMASTIVIPEDYALKMAVFAALSSDKQPETANNGFNFVFGRYNVIVNPYLNQFITSGSKPWILMAGEYSKAYAGAVWFDRNEMEVDSWVDKNTNAMIYDDYARWSAGFNDWRFALCGGMASGSALIG